MAKKDWTRIVEERNRSKPIPAPSPRATETSSLEAGKLTPAQRRARMLEQAERQGQTVETIALLSLVRTVDGFTNMGAVYAVPTRVQIEAEFVRGARSENQARGRVWKRLREQHQRLDYEMHRERKDEQYARPSDWERLFAALIKATRPTGARDVFSVQAAQSPVDRTAFRKWADGLGLNGDGLVHAAQAMREMYEAETGKRFQPEKVIPKIQAFTVEQLDAIIRSGFGPDDTFASLGYQEGYIPISKLADRFNPAQQSLRDRQIREDARRLIQEAPPASSQPEQDQLNQQEFLRAKREYDGRHFSVVYPDRNSVAFETGIVGGIFAQIKTVGGSATGFGYHGIIQPDLLKILPAELIVTERGKPRVRPSDGKTVVRIERWIAGKDGISLMEEEEVVASPETQSLEQQATRKIADAIVYDIHEKVPEWVVYRKYIERPYYWDEVHWEYKKAVEERLPFLASVAGVDPKPIEKFSGDDQEKEWMHARILSTGVTADKQLNDFRDRFNLTMENVFPDASDRSALERADRLYPETIKLGHYPFDVKYELAPDQRTVKKAVIHILDQGSYGNTYKLKDARPSDLPVLGTPEEPVELVFHYEQRSSYFHQEEDYPSARFRELLERVEPQERMIESKWIDFQHTEEGKLRIPLTITIQDPFPTKEQLRLLLAPHKESVVFVTDRDGNEHAAHISLWYVKGDQYDMGYAKDQKTAQEALERAREKHHERQAAARARAGVSEATLEKQLAPIRELERKIKAYTQEFENDNLVAFVLGRPPFSEDDQDRLNQALGENNYQYAELILRNAITSREMNQDLIDAMRAASSVVLQLRASGFDWEGFNVNKRNRGGDDFGGYRGRPDTEGFYPGDIKVHKSEVYIPSMGRRVGHRLNGFRLRSELPQFQRRLEFELEQWKLKKDRLRAERESGSNEPNQPLPEVIQRGRYSEDEDEEG